MITFNLGLETDDERHESFLCWAREATHPSIINRILRQSAYTKEEIEKLRKATTNKYKSLIPIGFDGYTITDKLPMTKIIALVEKGEDVNESIKLIEQSPNLENIFDWEAIQMIAAGLVDSPIPPEGVEIKFGIPAELTKRFRKNELHLDEIPIKYLKYAVGKLGVDYKNISYAFNFRPDK